MPSVNLNYTYSKTFTSCKLRTYFATETESDIEFVDLNFGACNEHCIVSIRYYRNLNKAPVELKKSFHFPMQHFEDVVSLTLARLEQSDLTEMMVWPLEDSHPAYMDRKGNDVLNVGTISIGINGKTYAIVIDAGKNKKYGFVMLPSVLPINSGTEEDRRKWIMNLSKLYTITYLKRLQNEINTYKAEFAKISTTVEKNMLNNTIAIQ